jgi:hydroxypyruvate isomerase
MLKSKLYYRPKHRRVRSALQYAIRLSCSRWRYLRSIYIYVYKLTQFKLHYLQNIKSVTILYHKIKKMILVSNNNNNTTLLYFTLRALKDSYTLHSSK